MTESSPLRLVGLAVTALLGLALVVGLLVGAAASCKSYNRYQARADAENDVKVLSIRVHGQAQRVKIATQSADIKHETAKGQRAANEEIAGKLTPLFVQYEMIEALKSIAASGKNNSVVYIPSGANGVPLVSVSGQPQVYGGDAEPSGGR